MPRLPRFFVPGLPLHVVQRGNNRSAVFAMPGDFTFFHECLIRASMHEGVAVHAYVLMTNHVHLLVTPRGPSALPRMMQWVGTTYVTYFNRQYSRTGTLWDGRYKAAIVDDERYLLSCMRYIELNPVRAGMVGAPNEYRWSSHHVNAYGRHDRLVTAHPAYLEIGADDEGRRNVYRGYFASTPGPAELGAIRDATQHGWALGSEGFRTLVSSYGRRAQRLSVGRRPHVKARTLALTEAGADPVEGRPA